MSSTTLNNIHENGRAERRAVPETVSRIAQSIGRFFTLSRAQRELDELDDRMLADIGLRRGDIRRVVWGGRRFF
jgi:uncharacterized protein YjiS (DUF1127 family)